MTIEIEPYDPQLHKEALSKLYQEGNLPPETVDFVSDTGFLAVDKNNDKIVGATFLVTTNSPVSVIDFFVVSKELDKDQRNLVIEHLLALMVALSMEWGFKVIIAEPRFGKSIRRLKDLGFTEFKEGSYWLRF